VTAADQLHDTALSNNRPQLLGAVKQSHMHVRIVAHQGTYPFPSLRSAPCGRVAPCSNGVRIIATPVPHYETVGPVAYRLEWNGMSVTYSGAVRAPLYIPRLASLVPSRSGPLWSGAAVTCGCLN
jgi:hypothetical protein